MTVQHWIRGTGAPHQRPLQFFTSLGRPLEKYFAEIVKARGATPAAELWTEAEERLAQLDFLICRITELQEQADKISRDRWAAMRLARDDSGGDKDRFLASDALRESNRLTSLLSELQFEIKLSAEAFYYFAARFIGILSFFPQLKNFEAPGIRNVRNRLIEHPEKGDSGVTQQNWGYGGQAGPTLKNLRRPGQENVPADAGLFVNAAELRDRLERRLGKILTAVASTSELAT